LNTRAFQLRTPQQTGVRKKKAGKGREIFKDIVIVVQPTVDRYFSSLNDLSGRDRQ
jgi:hypothetical protein